MKSMAVKQKQQSQKERENDQNPKSKIKNESSSVANVARSDTRIQGSKSASNITRSWMKRWQKSWEMALNDIQEKFTRYLL